ncbi:helix-turn-helix domain-containing protein [Nocardia sp. CA-290969]|uniref:helix-turn-helix domain-containing protein n=1 Tax=Nocardia sp. CA-290969 TaxID=3239986 RepID=UPI003D8A1FD4
MSWQASRWAARVAKTESGSEKCVLLVMAEIADEHGQGVRVSQGTLEERCCFTERTVRRALIGLETRGLIRRGNQRLVQHLPVGRRPVVWDLVLTEFAGSEDLLNDDFGEDTVSPQAGHNVRSDTVTPQGGHDVPSEGTESPLDRGHCVPSRGDTMSDKASLEASFEASSSSSAKSPTTRKQKPKREPQRDDVDALCNRLRESVIANGSKPPTITEAWRREARLLLDRDGPECRGVDLQKALNVLDWSQQDPFWKDNIRSMPKFRKQYDVLRGRALAEYERNKSHGREPSAAPMRDPRSGNLVEARW